MSPFSVESKGGVKGNERKDTVWELNYFLWWCTHMKLNLCFRIEPGCWKKKSKQTNRSFWSCQEITQKCPLIMKQLGWFSSSESQLRFGLFLSTCPRTLHVFRAKIPKTILSNFMTLVLQWAFQKNALTLIQVCVKGHSNCIRHKVNLRCFFLCV